MISLFLLIAWISISFILALNDENFEVKDGKGEVETNLFIRWLVTFITLPIVVVITLIAVIIILSPFIAIALIIVLILI